jgi:hypothetical protein
MGRRRATCASSTRRQNRYAAIEHEFRERSLMVAAVTRRIERTASALSDLSGCTAIEKAQAASAALRGETC